MVAVQIWGALKFAAHAAVPLFVKDGEIRGVATRPAPVLLLDDIVIKHPLGSITESPCRVDRLLRTGS